MRRRPGAGGRAARGEQLKTFKSLLLPAVWVLGTLISTGVAYGAVQMVSGSVVESQREPRTSASPAAGAASPVTGTPPGSPSPQPTTSPSQSPVIAPPTAPPPRSPAPPPTHQPSSNTRTFALIGGTTQLACSGDSIALDWATPNTGFWVETSTENGGATIEVRFRSDSHESRLDARCSGGTVQFNVREEAS
jgi:hypothetical protein